MISEGMFWKACFMVLQGLVYDFLFSGFVDPSIDLWVRSVVEIEKVCYWLAMLFRCVLASLQEGVSVRWSVRPSIRPSVTLL